MSTDIRKKINELRKQGYGYKKIAKELSITPSAVRHACSKIEEETILKGYCKNCEKEMVSIKGKKKKTFCRIDAGGSGGMSKEKDRATMNRSNLEMYYLSIQPFEKMNWFPFLVLLYQCRLYHINYSLVYIEQGNIHLK